MFNLDPKTGKALDLSGAFLFALALATCLYLGFSPRFSFAFLLFGAACVASFFVWRKKEDPNGSFDARLEFWTVALLVTLGVISFVAGFVGMFTA